MGLKKPQKYLVAFQKNIRYSHNYWIFWFIWYKLYSFGFSKIYDNLRYSYTYLKFIEIKNSLHEFV